MEDNCEKKIQTCPYRSTIKIIGKLPFSRLPTSTSPTPNSPYHSLTLPSHPTFYCPQLQSKPQTYSPMAKKIYLQSNLLAFIDYYDNLWFFSDLFSGGVNITLLLGRRARNLFLSENQCIISNKRNPVLLNWGAKKIIDVSTSQLLKINQKYNRNPNTEFIAYSLHNSNKDDRFFYSNLKKVDNSNKLYQLKVQVVGQEDQECNGGHGGHGKGVRRMKSVRRREKCRSELADEEIYSVIAYPTMQNFVMKSKVVGISVGKFHCMCWDAAGLLYTWGNRSLALGYEELPREKITTKPRHVHKMNKFVTMAFAATHYSMALTSDGHIYEWGIKKQSNQINQELIFDPKVLKLDERGSRVIMLKGKGDQFACLNSRHQLFLWGEKSAKFLDLTHPSIAAQFSNFNIYKPFLVPGLEGQNVVDFAIGDMYIAVIVSTLGEFLVSEEEKVYWNDMLKKIKSKLKMPGTVKTQAAEPIRQSNAGAHIRKSDSCAQQLAPLNWTQSTNEFKSNIEKCYEERSLKKQYFRSLKNENKFFLNLMRTSKENLRNSYGSQSNQGKDQSKQLSASRFLQSQRRGGNKENFKKMLSESRFINKLKQNTKVKDDDGNALGLISELKDKTEGNEGQFKEKDKEKEEKDNLLNSSMKASTNWFSLTLRESSKPFSQRIKKRCRIQQVKKQIEPYQLRLERVQQKKKSLQQNFTQQISKKVQQNSIEYRNLRHQQILQAKIQQKNRNLLKHTLQAFLIKHYLVRMILSPVEEARKIKIEQFAKSLHLSRIQKNLRSIFVKARVRHRLGKLKKCNFIIYALLCHVFKRYVKKRRQQKTRNMRKMVAQQLFKNVLKQKIKFGLSKTHLNTRKLQKFREWLVTTKLQRLRCLRILWKTHLLSIMKVTNQTDAITICKAQENCTFESLYKQKLQANPMLKLQTFLNKSPIFELRSEYFQSIIFLFRKDNRVKSEKLLKDSKSRRKLKIIKFSSENETITINLNPHQSVPTNYLLPYSLHYPLLIRPKSMQINIPESMKKSQKWVKEEITIFQNCLKDVIEAHEKSFVKARRKYEIDLAYFIREKYEALAEKRWKCIVEYNLIKKTPYKAKKEKELYRLFDMIGMQKILNEDCLPEKYLMLEQAIKRRDAPVPPSSFLVFGLVEFKEVFKRYYETVAIRAKWMRKNYV